MRADVDWQAHSDSSSDHMASITWVWHVINPSPLLLARFLTDGYELRSKTIAEVIIDLDSLLYFATYE